MKKTQKDTKIRQAKTQSNSLPKESEVWDLSDLDDGKNFDIKIKDIQKDVDTFTKYRSILNDKITPQKVLEIIQFEERIMIKYSKLDVYYSFKYYENTKDEEAVAKTGQLKQVAADIGNKTMFFSLWFKDLKDEVANNILNSKVIKSYKYYLTEIRKSKPYTKSEEIEQIIHLKNITGAGGYYDIYSIMTTGFKYEMNKKPITKEELTSLFHSDNPKIREEAYKKILESYKDHSDILTEIYKNIVTDWYVEGVKIRGYKSSINIRNFGHDITDKTVESLFNIVRKNTSIFQEYFKIKHKLNNKSGQKYPYSRYHLYAPFKVESKKYPYTESKNYVLETFKKFDERFYIRAKKIFDAKHVHSHPVQNKRTGAFCCAPTNNITPYVMLNHTESLRSVFTIIHEFGHAVHFVFASEKQPTLQLQASLPLCETASVFGEMLLSERILAESKSDDEKRAILVQLLDNQWATIIRQSYFAIFEKYAHNAIQNGATKKELDDEYYKLLKEQFADMEIPDLFKHEWNYIPHIHETPFYVYAYAFGNLLVLALYEIYRKDAKSFKEKYIELLQAGNSDSTANLIKKFGFDIESEEFWQKGFDIIKEEVETLEKLAK